MDRKIENLGDILEAAGQRALDELFERIGVSMASFIAAIDSSSSDVARYITQRLEPLKFMASTDFRVRDAMESIARDGRQIATHDGGSDDEPA